MEKILLLTVRFLDDRYHGEDEWPPSPARLFQALVAGNAVGADLPEPDRHALRWLEDLPAAPQIRAQQGRLGLSYTTFVPNNDLDAKGGDPAKVSDIRVGKSIRPRHINAAHPILYGWRFPEDGEPNARHICTLAENLYQLGRGVDMAWAQADVLPEDEGEKRLTQAIGAIYRPGTGAGALALECPQRGSLDSLLKRFQARSQRFRSVKDGKKIKVHFTNPPKAGFRQIAYNPLPDRRLFGLRQSQDTETFRPWPREQAVALTEQVRDALAERLNPFLPDQTDQIETLLIGRNATPEDKARRVRLIPIPSIGHEHADPAIRRFLIEAPPDCPLPIGDLAWGLSGLRLGEDEHTTLVATENPSMLRHYAVETDVGLQRRRSGKRTQKRADSSNNAYYLWRSITPLALHAAMRRRISPKTLRAEAAARRQGDAGAAAKPGFERAREEAAAIRAVHNALRHAGIESHALKVHVQREPFDKRGVRAEAFASGARFPKERLWHVALEFDRPVSGPLLLGDGRYVGLGLMAPPEAARDHSGVFGFHIASGLKPGAPPAELTAALRRAVMALAQEQISPKHALAPFFTGHAQDGSPLREGDHRHLSFAADLKRSRLLIIAPHILEHRKAHKNERDDLQSLNEALRRLDRLRAGPAGLLTLKPVFMDQAEDPLFRAAAVWESITPYRPTRHPKKGEDEEAFVKRNVLEQLAHYTNEIPAIEAFRLDSGPRRGLSARLRLRFRQGVSGPLLLGRDRHKGGGLFGAAE